MMKMKERRMMMTHLNCKISEKHSIPISSLRHHLSTYTHLSPPVQELCSHYYLKYWAKSFFDTYLHDGMLTYNSDGIIYQCVYPNGAASLKHCTQVKLSFRKSHDVYGGMAYVIVLNGDMK